MSAVAGDPMFERFGRSCATGTVLFREGDPGQEMFVLQSGRVQLTRRSRNEEKIVAVLTPGEFFGEMAIVNNRPRSATATVIADATLLAIDARTFEAMVRGNAEIAVRLLKKLASRLDQANRQIEILLVRDSTVRVVQALGMLAETIGSPDGEWTRVELSAAELADRLGLSDGDLDQVLRRLEASQLVALEKGRGFRVADGARLAECVSYLGMAQR
jgi:CRP-like cAMP-binding protein